MTRQAPDSARGLSRIKYPRSTYHSRGKRPTRDIIAESFAEPSCVICGTGMPRKVKRNGQLEPSNSWLKRKTCGRYLAKDGEWKYTECLKEYISGKGNGNYKGLLRFCLDCKVKIKTYSTKYGRSHGVEDPVRCQSCWMNYAKEHEIYIKRNRANGLKRRGIYPEHLKPYALKKGHVTWNKKYDNCQIENCGRKHWCKGMCGMHYQRANKGR